MGVAEQHTVEGISDQESPLQVGCEYVGIFLTCDRVVFHHNVGHGVTREASHTIVELYRTLDSSSDGVNLIVHPANV